jgi:hypothetical protein
VKRRERIERCDEWEQREYRQEETKKYSEKEKKETSEREEINGTNAVR